LIFDIRKFAHVRISFLGKFKIIFMYLMYKFIWSLMLGVVIRAQYCERKKVYWKSHAPHAQSLNDP